jgi:ABC-2 type transport system permease protein
MKNVLLMTRRIVRSVATKGRLSAIAAAGIFGIIIGFIVDRSDPGADFEPAEFLGRFGLTIFVPIVALVVASATLGTLVEEQTLIYFWLRPIGRWQLALAGFLASFAVLLPTVLIPMGILGAVVGDGSDVAGILVASAVGVVGYGSVFTMLGLFTQRALLWGLVYVLVWEGFIAGLSRGAGWLALSTYSWSALAQRADADIIDNPVQLSTTIIVSAAIAVATFAITTWRLTRMTVD